jgi:hypothetical protein
MDSIRIIIGLLIFAGSACAGSYRVHYNVRGSGRDIGVQAANGGIASRLQATRLAAASR